MLVRFLKRASHSVAASSSPAPTNLKKFWKVTTIKEAESGHGFNILLDGKPLKTPTGKILCIPGEKKNLTLLTAAEWELQDTVLKSYSLPLVCFTLAKILTDRLQL